MLLSPQELWCTGFEDLPLRPWAPRNDCTWSLHGSFVVDAAEERNGVAVPAELVEVQKWQGSARYRRWQPV